MPTLSLDLVIVLNVTDWHEQLAMETGFTSANAWLEWVRFTGRQLGKENCYVCAKGRPQLVTVPFPLNTTNDPTSLQCVL